MRNWPVIWYAMLFVLFVADANAQECFSPTPTEMIEPGLPAPIESRDLSRDEYDDLKVLFKGLKGKWEGSGEEIKCKGKLPDPSRTRIDFTIEAESGFDYQGRFFLEGELYDPEKRISRGLKKDIFLMKTRLRSDNKSRDGDVELMEVAADSVQFRKRILLTKNDPRRPKTWREVFTTIRRIDGGFEFQEAFYFRGMYTGEMNLRLSKR